MTPANTRLLSLPRLASLTAGLLLLCTPTVVSCLAESTTEARKKPEANDGESWPQFRGPDGQGHVAGKIPTSWSEKDNKAWEVPIPGKGWSSPVIADGKIWLTTALPASKGGFTLRAIAIDQQSGKLLHDIELFSIARAVELHGRNSLATPSPVLGKGRLYASFGSEGTACVETKAGKVVWRNTELKVDYQTGAASSPVLFKDRLVFSCDGADAQYAVALSTATGKILWKTDRAGATRKPANERRAFATPLLISVGGQDQVVMPGAQCVYSCDLSTGAEIWRVAYEGFSNVPRPVFAHGLVMVSTGYFAHELLAIRPDGKGDVTKTHIAWRYPKGVPNVPSPVVVGEYLFMVSDQGIATCLNAKTGALKWTKRLHGTFTASLLATDKRIYAFSDDGRTVVFEAAPAYKEMGRGKRNGRIQATPAVAGDCLFIRTDEKLIKVCQKTDPITPSPK